MVLVIVCKTFAYIFAGILLCAGFFFLKTGSSLDALFQKCSQQCTEQTKATIRRIEKKADAKASKGYQGLLYTPYYEYKAQGTIWESKGLCCGSEENFRVGNTVEIYYNPNNPEECYVPMEEFQKSIRQVKVLGASCVGCAVLCTIAGILMK